MKYFRIPLLVLFAVANLPAATIVVPASMDNTLFEDATGALSNGRGQFLFAGRTGVNNDFKVRRAVLGFDIAGAIPAGSMIDSVTLRLYINATSPAEPVVSLELHRLLASWGEGTSNAGAPGGDGAPAATGDATWIHRTYNTSTWNTPGGDFASSPSAVVEASAIGTVEFSGGSLVDEVRSWLGTPTSNFGWLILGDEDSENTSKRFASRENAAVGNRPALIVEFTPVPEPTGLAAVGFAALSCFWRPRRRGSD